MVWIGFWACGFGTSSAWAAENFHGFILGQNISNSGHFRATFRPHLGHNWATFGPPLYLNNVNKVKKSKYNLLKIYVKLVNNLGKRLNFSKLWWVIF